MADETEDDSPSASIRRMAGPLERFIPEEADGLFSGLDSVINTLFNALNDFMLSIFNRPQRAAKNAFVENLSDSAGTFTGLASELGLEASVGDTIREDCERFARDTFTGEFMGLGGMSTDAEQQAQRLLDLHQRLEARILRELVSANPTVDDSVLAERASAAASRVTGIAADQLGSEHAATRIAANPPTDGIGGQLFGIRQSIANEDSTITVPDFTLAAAVAAAPPSRPAEEVYARDGALRTQVQGFIDGIRTNGGALNIIYDGKDGSTADRRISADEIIADLRERGVEQITAEQFNSTYVVRQRAEQGR